MDFNLTVETTFLLGVAVFWLVLYVLANLFHLNKYGLDVKPAYFMYKSKALNSSLDKVAKKKPALWTVLSNIGLAFSIGLMAFSIYFLTNNLLRFIFPIGPVAPIYPVIPVLTIRLYWLPYFFIAIAVIFLSHELAHGIVARLENIPVLSTGILAFLVFFGAFVEPDEKEFEKTPLKARLRMLSAGSSINLVAALLVLILLHGLFMPPTGILIHETIPDGPLEKAGLGRWDVIQAINGTPVVNYDNFSKYMNRVKPGERLNLTVFRNNHVDYVQITTFAAENNKSRAIIGSLYGWASYQPNRLGLDQYTGVNLYWTLFWTYGIGVSVAIFNMLPLFPFDGERVLYYPLAHFVKKRKKELRIAISAFSLTLFALNIFLSIWRYGLLAI